MLNITREVLEQSFAALRTCGAGRAECVVFWVGALERPEHVDEVVHPRHTATAVGYDVDPMWIGEFWLDLAERACAIRAQVHTHPGPAFHSTRDDSLPLIHTEGYLSLVIPRFASGPVGLSGTHLAERSSDGQWGARDPRELLAVT